MTMYGALRLLLAASLTCPLYVARSEDIPQAQLPPLTLEQRGDLYMARKMYREAVDVYRQAMPQGNAWVLSNKVGIAYHQMQDFRAAKKNYDQALKLNPKYAEAHNNIGALDYAQRNFRGAIREYQRALKLSSDSATIYSNLGTAYFARKTRPSPGRRR